jgi:hypothetical protein
MEKFAFRSFLILLTIVGQVAIASPCGDALEALSRLKDTSTRATNDHLREALAAIKTPDDAVKFWKALLHQFKRHGLLITEDLVTEDYVKHLTTLEPELQRYKTDRMDLVQVIKEIASLGPDFKKLVAPALFILEPNAHDVIEHFSQYSINSYTTLLDSHALAATEFNYATATALSHLPIQEKTKVKSYYTRLYQKLLRDREGDKVARRNVETILRAIDEKEFQQFFSSIKNIRRLSLRNAPQLIDGYWKSIGLNTYSFEKAISVAKIIQSSPLFEINENMKHETMFLYGSFVNGKAAFPSSDVDLHLGMEMTSIYRTQFQDRLGEGTYAKPVGNLLSPLGEHVSEAFLTTEASIRSFLKLNSTSGDLLTVVTEKPMWDERDPFRPENIALYNPIFIEVSATKITIVIYDAFGTKELVKIDVI